MLRQFSAGGIVFKKLNNDVLWLITKSSPSPEYPNEVWRLQKGWLDDIGDGKKPGILTRGEKKANENQIKEAALREVREEGGVKAKIVKKIGTEKYFIPSRARNKLDQKFIPSNDEKILKFVTFYLMEWQEDLPEGPGFETSEVKWLPFIDAKDLLTYPGEKKMLEKANELLTP